MILALLGEVLLSSAVLAAENQDKTAAATPALVREIQFMLLTVGIDPGPIDGNPKQLTNRAAHIFQQQRGLPISEIVENGSISELFLERLRREAAQIMLKDKQEAASVAPQIPSAASSPAALPPAETAAVRPEPPPPPPSPPPDQFASCGLSPEDFRIGGKQYTAQSFLEEGFGGSTTRAVADLRQRLEEARQIAERIGGTALGEVQRQARVLSYFECRLKIEQASAGKG
jgi:peptidoglycan hydrolase-like protein with peptidoglycan-binding domain